MENRLQISDFIKNKTSVFGNIIIRGNEHSDLFNEVTTAGILNAGGLLFCTAGSAEFVLNEHHYNIGAKDLVVAFPGDTLQIVNRNDEFVGYIMGVNTEVIVELNIPRASEQYLMIKDSPCRHLTDNDIAMLVDTYNIVDRLSSYRTLPNAGVMIHQIITAICYGIAGLYLLNTPLKEKEFHSRTEYLFRRFVALVNDNCQRHHDVQYYADKLCISTKYLSFVVKRYSDYPPSLWIEKTLIGNIKLALASTDDTIQQIAYRFEFANPSSFSQYFRRVTGMTPKEYRKRQNKLI